jgi:predicted O-methyltransferase YrrM
MNIKNLICNLLTPHKIPLKIFNRIFFSYLKKNYKYDVFEKEQNKIFEDFTLNRNNGLKKLELIKEKYTIFNRNMASEHECVFSSLSISNRKINTILEIGTFDGVNSFLLSLLFDKAQIETIDLESNTDDFKKFYNRSDTINEFVSSRNAVISKSNRITFKEMNSIKLYNSDKKFDLIWIDGAHGYPIVCIDIINSLNLLNEGGLVMCDDIYTNKITSDKMYYSNAAIETLRELANEKIIEYKLIYKRLDVENNFNKDQRRFIGIFKKI